MMQRKTLYTIVAGALLFGAQGAYAASGMETPKRDPGPATIPSSAECLRDNPPANCPPNELIREGARGSQSTTGDGGPATVQPSQPAVGSGAAGSAGAAGAASGSAADGGVGTEQRTQGRDPGPQTIPSSAECLRDNPPANCPPNELIREKSGAKAGDGGSGTQQPDAVLVVPATPAPDAVLVVPAEPGKGDAAKQQGDGGSGIERPGSSQAPAAGSSSQSGASGMSSGSSANEVPTPSSALCLRDNPPAECR